MGFSYVRNALTSTPTIVTNSTSPLPRLNARLTSKLTSFAEVTKEIGSLVNLVDRWVDRCAQATQGARSSPFSNGVMIPCASYSAGTTVTIPHRLGTANVEAIWGVARSGTPFATITTDASNVYLAPTSTFTATLWLVPVPFPPSGTTGPASVVYGTDWTTDTAGGTVALPTNVPTWDLSASSGTANTYTFSDTVSVDHVIVWLSGTAPVVDAPAGWNVLNPLTGSQSASSYTYSVNLSEGYAWRINGSGKLLIPY